MITSTKGSHRIHGYTSVRADFIVNDFPKSDLLLKLQSPK
jgi:hypothetical protein